MNKLGGWVPLLVLIALAFIGGRFSVTGCDQKCTDSLAVYRVAKLANQAERDSMVRIISAVRVQAAAAESSAAVLRRQAQRREVVAALFGAKADSLERLLALATTPRDSARILGEACTERRNECQELRGANADLTKAASEDEKAKQAMRAEIAAHLVTRGSDSTQAVRADRLIGKLERSVRGCRLPLIGFPCPVGQLSYDLDAKALNAGVGLRVKSWLTLGLTKRIWKP